MITTLRFVTFASSYVLRMTRQKSTSIQETFHPGHQEVECHERDFPKYEEMTEASADKNSVKKEDSMRRVPLRSWRYHYVQFL